MRSICAGLFALMAVFGGSARAADHLECMDGQFGSVEQEILDRVSSGREQKDQAADDLVDKTIALRAQACGHIHHWSDKATHTAIVRRQWGLIRALLLSKIRLTDAERGRLSASLEPKRAEFLALFAPSVKLLAAGEAPPPPAPGMFRDFQSLIDQAGVVDNEAKRNAVTGWLYVQGMIDALALAFATE